MIVLISQRVFLFHVVILIFLLVSITTPVSAAIHTLNPGDSIRQNITDATAGDTIILNPGTYTENGITVDKNIRIQANTSYSHTAAETIIDGGNHQIMTVSGGVNLVIDSLTLQNGLSVNGGAIANSGTITISDSVFTSCSGANGGAIFNNNGGTLIISSTTFSDGSATNGGEIFNNGGTLTISSTTFSDCTATNAGGAIYNDAGTLTISSTTFSGCSSVAGGAIYTDAGTLIISTTTFSGCSGGNGGAILSISGSLTISSTAFIKCSADVDGGAVYASTSTLLVDHSSSFRNCTAAAGRGGAIKYAGTSFTINSADFVNCSTSLSEGGAIFANKGSITSATFTDCSAPTGGGAIFFNAGTSTLDKCIFTRCSAVSGGAVFNNWSKLTISDTSFISCSGTNGGTIFNNGSTLIISSSTFTNCSATTDGGAIYIGSGGIGVTITSSTFTGCTAVNSGGAIYSVAPAASMSTVVNFSRFYQNTAGSGAAIYNTGGVSASYNWWGTNTILPAYVSGTGTTTSGPYLMLSTTTTSPSITSAQTSLIKAYLTYDSTGINTRTEGHIPNGTPVMFTISSGPGSLSAAANTTTLGAAETTFIPDGAGTTVINAIVDGQTVNTTVTVPGPVFTGTPRSGTAPLSVTFTDASVGSPTMWNWSFGDGQWYNTTVAANPVHTYTGAGTYTVSLTTTISGTPCTHSRAGYISVSNPSPALSSSGGDDAPGGTSGTGNTGHQQLAPLENGVNVNVGGNSGITSVLVIGNGLDNLIVTGTVRPGPGTGVSPAPGTTYQYIDLVPAQFTSIDGATITFTIPVSWLEEHHILPESIVLYHFINGAWVALPTTVVTTANGMFTFAATTPSFSLYAISGMPHAASTSNQQVQTFGDLAGAPATSPAPARLAPPEPQTTTVPAPTVKPDGGFPVPVLVIAIAGIIIVAAGGFMVRRWWIRRQNPALFKEYD